MEYDRKRLVLLLMMVSHTMNTVLHAAPVDEGLVNSDLNGQELVQMGNVLNKPLLTLLGKTFIKVESNINENFSRKVDDVESQINDIINLSKERAKETQAIKTELCNLKSCTEWTQWSLCSARVLGTFGASTRTRICGRTSSFCPSNVNETEEIESKICQGRECNTSKYTKTENGYCIRLTNTVSKSWTDAQDECHKDGARLINIDSELKAADVNTTLQAISFTSYLWIDGTRTLPNGEWKYEYGSEDTNFSIWPNGEPGSTDDCKAYVYRGGKWWWFGRLCSTKYYFICEKL